MANSTRLAVLLLVLLTGSALPTRKHQYPPKARTLPLICSFKLHVASPVVLFLRRWLWFAVCEGFNPSRVFRGKHPQGFGWLLWVWHRFGLGGSDLLVTGGLQAFLERLIGMMVTRGLDLAIGKKSRRGRPL